MSGTQAAEVFTGASHVQATGDVTATQPGEAPSTRGDSAATMTATRPVEAPGTGRYATQPVEASGALADCTLSPPVLVLEMISAFEQKCSGTANNSKIPEVLQQGIFSTKKTKTGRDLSWT